jgi:sugar phosphate isomerase/epimerase
MKLSIAVSEPDAKFSALALKGEFEETFRAASGAGFDGAELHIRNPALVDAGRVGKLLEDFSLVAPAIGTGRAFGEDGLCFSSPDEKIRREAVERIKSHIDFAEGFGALVIIGLIVGKNPVTPESERWAAECLAECAGRAERRGIKLAVEPINRYETSFIITVDDCLRFLDKVGSPACGVLLDTFHMNIEEASIENSIRLAGSRAAHVHIADSNRRHPGAGHIDFRSVVDALSDIGYNGFLSAEIFPLPDPETAAVNTVEHMKKILAG